MPEFQSVMDYLEPKRVSLGEEFKSFNGDLYKIVECDDQYCLFRVKDNLVYYNMPKFDKLPTYAELYAAFSYLNIIDTGHVKLPLGSIIYNPGTRSYTQICRNACSTGFYLHDLKNNRPLPGSGVDDGFTYDALMKVYGPYIKRIVFLDVYING